jgi:hypothetical protein
VIASYGMHGEVIDVRSIEYVYHATELFRGRRICDCWVDVIPTGYEELAVADAVCSRVAFDVVDGVESLVDVCQILHVAIVSDHE